MDKRLNKYLLDTNILIYYFADEIPPKELETIEDIFKTSFYISVITRIEFLGWKKHTEKGYEKAKEFISFSKVIYLTKKIADKAINIRREYRIKLPDAVIAATASSKNLTLVTRNDDDFRDIQYLEIYNPFE
jgi:predicted nucleic acid-binding protein